MVFMMRRYGLLHPSNETCCQKKEGHIGPECTGPFCRSPETGANKQTNKQTKIWHGKQRIEREIILLHAVSQFSVKAHTRKVWRGP